MTSNREKTSNVMGFVVSVLLHGIFLAGCLALDASSMSSPVSDQDTEIKSVTDQTDVAKSKS